MSLQCLQHLDDIDDVPPRIAGRLLICVLTIKPARTQAASENDSEAEAANLFVTSLEGSLLVQFPLKLRLKKIIRCIWSSSLALLLKLQLRLDQNNAFSTGQMNV